MLVKLSGDNFIIALDADEAAMLVEDVVQLVANSAVHATTWTLANRITEVWWHREGCPIGAGIEEVVMEEDGK